MGNSSSVAARRSNSKEVWRKESSALSFLLPLWILQQAVQQQQQQQLFPRHQELLTVSFLLSTRTLPITNQQRPEQTLRGGGVRSTSSQANNIRKTIGCTPVIASLLVDPVSANSPSSTRTSPMLAALMSTTPAV